MLLSAVVPTWREAPRMASLVRALAAEVDEVVVADAHSPDGTADEAARAGARVVQAEKGRGPQLAAGARLAAGDALVFVHADTHVPTGFGRAIRSSLADPEIVGGNFRLRFVPESASARLFTVANDLRRRLFAIYYGDSCIFVRRAAYQAIGGFDDLPVFEDHLFVARLESQGRTRYLRHPEITTSARRFESQPLRTLALWGALQLGFYAGLPPAALARFYPDHR